MVKIVTITRKGQTERIKEDGQEDTVEINLCDNLKELMIRMDKRMENYELIGSSDGMKAAVKEETEEDFVVRSLQHNSTRY